MFGGLRAADTSVQPALARMWLDRPNTFADRLYRILLNAALKRSGGK
jgi:hypothetical protein